MDQILSPIKEFRNHYGLSLSVFAARCETTSLAITRTEQAVFNSVPPSVARGILLYDPITTSRGYALTDADSIQEAYEDFQRLSRRSAFGLLTPRLPDYRPEVSPLVQWRLYSNLPSQMGFCRAFCVHPSPTAQFERGLQKRIPQQLLIALTQAGYSAATLNELQARQELFIDSKRKFKQNAF